MSATFLRFFIIIFCLLVEILHSPSAQAGRTFENVDLSSRFPSFLRDQGKEASWCYADAAADLLSAHYGRAVSASDVLISYIAKMDPFSRAIRLGFLSDDSDFDGGWLAEAAAAAAKHGVCLAQKKTPNGDVWAGFNEDSPYGLIWAGALDNYSGAHSKLDVLNEMITEENFIKRGGDPRSTRLQTWRILKTFTNVTSEQMHSLWMRSKNFPHFLELMRDQECSGNTLPPEHLRIVTNGIGVILGGFDSLLDELDDQISNYNPVGITIYPRFLFAPKYRGGIGMHFSLHSTIVAGREYRDGQWKYLIRNSWGTWCDGYASSIECSVEHPGYIWIGRDQLNNNLTQIVYLKP